MTEAVPDRLSELPASWLLANCQCPACVDPVSGQRLLAISDPEPDGHRPEHPAAWLAAATEPSDSDDRTEDAKRLWSAKDFPAGPPTGSWPKFQSDPKHKAWCLSSILTDGFVLLTGTPVTFSYRDATADLRATLPMIGLSARGRIRLSPARATATSKAATPTWTA